MPTHKYCLTIEKINLTNYGLRMALTRYLVVWLSKYTARWVCAKAGKLSFEYPNGLLAKIIHSNLTNKMKAQSTELFSVSCAFFSSINQLFINNFCCPVVNIIHLSHTQHHIYISCFKFFCNLFLLGKWFYCLLKYFFLVRLHRQDNCKAYPT